MLFLCLHSSTALVNPQLLAPSKPPVEEGILCSRGSECMNHFYCMPYMQNYHYLNLRWLISKIVQQILLHNSLPTLGAFKSNVPHNVLCAFSGIQTNRGSCCFQ